MLLSEVLRINKKLQYLNESYKSNTIRTIINLVNNSSKLHLELIDYSYRTTLYSKADVETRFWYIYSRYKNGYNTIVPNLNVNNITDAFNDPKIRLKILNTKIQIDNNDSFIKAVNNKLKTLELSQIDIANITEDQVVEVYDISQVKTKQYKKGLQFWVSYDNTLRAITCNNKIVCLCNPTSEYNWIALNNKDFIGTYTTEDLDEMFNQYNKENEDISKSDLFNEFLNNAFKFIPKYDFYYSEKSIKKQLNTNALSITKLIEYFNNIGGVSVYSITTEGMLKNDISDKMINRLEYKKYLYEMKHYLLIQQRRYKEIIQNKKNQLLKNSQENKVISTLHTCIDILSMIYNELINYITGSDNTLTKVYSYSITCPYEMYNLTLKSDILQNCISKRSYGRRSTSEYYTYISKKSELLLTSSVYILVLINKLETIISYYTKVESSTEDIIPHLLLSIKNSISNYNQYLFNYKKFLTSMLSYLIKEGFNNISTYFDEAKLKI